MALIILAVGDLPRSLRFYREAFGWPQRVDMPVYAEFDLPDGLRLGLYERETFGLNIGRAPFSPPAGELTATELYLYAEDAPALVRRLEAAGARRLSPLSARDWGDEAAYLADPDGNVLAVARPLMKLIS